MPSRARICFSLAHPDDESYSGVGTVCRYVAQGAEVVLITATRGGRGQRGHPPICSQDELPGRREAELREAASLAGIAHVHVLDYPDKELADAPVGQIRRELVDVLRRHRPHLVFTFDPNGFNGHPDHIAISRFTSDAIAAAADATWLPASGLPHRVQRLVWTSPIPPWDASRRGNLAAEPGVDFAIDVASWTDRKAAALRAHRTQHRSIDEAFFNQTDADRILSLETYRHAWGPPIRETPSSDLLEGIDLTD